LLPLRPLLLMINNKLTSDEAAARAKVSHRTIGRAFASGQLTKHREYGHALVDSVELMRWIAARNGKRKRTLTTLHIASIADGIVNRTLQGTKHETE
jgi:hypothetical protein